MESNIFDVLLPRSIETKATNNFTSTTETVFIVLNTSLPQNLNGCFFNDAASSFDIGSAASKDRMIDVGCKG